MPQTTEWLDPWRNVHCSSYLGMFPACISPALLLIEWNRHKLEPSYFVAAYIVHSSGCRLQITSQVGLSKISVLHEYFLDFRLSYAPLNWFLFFLDSFNSWLNLSSCHISLDSCKEYIRRAYSASTSYTWSQLIGKSLNCPKPINHWPHITCPENV